MIRFSQQPTRGITLLLFLILAGLVIASGCTSSAPQASATPAPTLPTGSSTVTAGATPSAPSSPGGSSTQAFDARTLNALFPPAPAGWTIEQQPAGSSRLDQDNNAWTASSATYASAANKETTASITIQDTVGWKVGYKNIWSTFTTNENSDGYFKSTTIQGNPAWATHSIAGKTYKTWISVNDRFMVYVSVENGSQADYDTIINAISFAGIAAMK
jgi:hypothetical protein